MFELKLQTFVGKMSFAIMAIAIALALYQTIRIVTLPEDSFISNTIIDDALYYVVPAYHFYHGYGWSFDRENLTNGFQPLWAIIVLGIVSVVQDKLLVLRVVVFLSAALHIIGSLLLWRWLYLLAPRGATVAAVGLLFSGFTNRLMFLGMENGLALFLYVCILKLFWLSVSEFRRRYLYGLSVLLSLFALVRVEYILFLPLVWVVLGVWDARSKARAHRGPRRIWFAGTLSFLPFAVWLGFSQIYFGTALPISGSVKLFYESQWPAWQGGLLNSLIWHAKRAIAMILAPLTLSAERFLWFELNLALPLLTKVGNYLLAFGLGIVGPGLLFRDFIRGNRGYELNRVTPLSLVVFSGVLFALGHGLAIAVFLPHFTLYGIWYFPVELATAWLMIGLEIEVFLNLLRKTRLLDILLPAAVLVVNSTSYNLEAGINFSNVNTFVQAARFMEEHLPAHSRIGTLSSGYVSWFAPSHTIINLDGLMNNVDFFENYLKRNRVADYVRTRNIEYLADYTTFDGWRRGYFPHTDLPLSDMELIYIFPMQGDAYADKYLYAIWGLKPDRSVIGDQLSKIWFDALVHRRYMVVHDSELGAIIGREPGLMILDSIHFADGTWHLLVSRPLEFRLKPSTLFIDNRVDIEFGDYIRLLGFDVSSRVVRRGSSVVIRRYWEVMKALPDGEWRIDMYIKPSEPAWWWHVTTGCYDTCPVGTWQAGDVYVESYRLSVPSDIAPGFYPVSIGIWNEASGWIWPNNRLDVSRPGMAFLFNLEVK